jgi:AcrR family transcriptional regulator
MEEKRHNIISKAFDLFRQFGIKSVSMDDLARELGMSKKTLYQHISDKNELVESVIEYLKKFLVDSFSIFNDTDLSAIEQHFEFRKRVQPSSGRFQPTLLYDMKKYYPALLQEINEQKFELFYSANLANLKQGKEEGLYNEDINEHIIARILVSFHLYTFDPSNGLFTDAEIMDDKTFEEVYKYHFRGICTSKGMDELQRLFCDNNN